MLVSRQMVLFCIERRKSWRLLQSRAGVVNHEYLAQRKLIQKVDGGDVPLEDFIRNTREMFDAELAALSGKDTGKEKKQPVAV
jgi:pyruvate-ferredoxin/flavodoxin oxidoreductase